MSILAEKATLQVSFPKEKLEALKFYMDEKDTTVEKELQGHIKSVYEKYVPVATRRYLDRKDSAEGLQAEVRTETEEQPQEVVAQAPSTRGRRRNSREQNQEANETNLAEVNTITDENQENIEEESQGMSMSM